MTVPQFARREIVVDGSVHRLGYRGHAIAAVLLAHRGKVLETPEIIEAVWWNDDEPEFAYECVQAAVMAIRKRVPGLIATEYGRGYSIPL